MGIAGQRTPPRMPDPATPDVDPGYRPPGAEAPPQSPADAAASAAIHRAPMADPLRPSVGISEHGAPAPSARIGPKLWVIAGLVLLLVAAGLAFG